MNRPSQGRCACVSLRSMVGWVVAICGAVCLAVIGVGLLGFGAPHSIATSGRVIDEAGRSLEGVTVSFDPASEGDYPTDVTSDWGVFSFTAEYFDSAEAVHRNGLSLVFEAKGYETLRVPLLNEYSAEGNQELLVVMKRTTRSELERQSGVPALGGTSWKTER